MPSSRLQLGLEKLPSTDWAFFERFAAEYLVEDYPTLRTTASAHGDLGRDGELFEVDGVPTHMVQYSLAADWRAKIRGTVNRLQETKPGLRVLIYVTARRIGPDGDELKRELLRGPGIVLDILDESYFLERELTSPQRRAAAQELIERVTLPYLRERGVLADVPQALPSADARLAILHLSLDARDEANEKNLTRSCFDSLVLAALHGTSAEEPIELEEILRRIESFMPAERSQQVEAHTRNALLRLTKKKGPIKQIGETGRYHLSFEQQQAVNADSASFLLRQERLEDELLQSLDGQVGSGFDAVARAAIAGAMRAAVERLLLQRGEQFVRALQQGSLEPPTDAEVSDIVNAVEMDSTWQVDRAQVQRAVTAVLAQPSDNTRSHLQSLADAYTMFAFLEQTPDVQKIANQLFTDGAIWLDTSIVLPLLAETAEFEDSRKPFTTVIRAAQASGINFHVTGGVVEEVETHIFRARRYAMGAYDVWYGRVPFLFTAYMTSGLARDEFADWVEEFRSDARPQEDVEEFLNDAFAISKRDLADQIGDEDSDLWKVVQEFWARAHEERRAAKGLEIDISTLLRLVSHDVENCVGVILARKESPNSPLGYRHWWLTLDRAAPYLDKALQVGLGRDAPRSPAMDPSYLIRVLRTSRTRAKISAGVRTNLPLLLEFPLRAHRPEDLIRVAEEIRTANAGKSERIIRHMIRDRMDELRTLRPKGASTGEQEYSSPFELATADVDG